MDNFFKSVGVIVLLLGTFVYTEKVATTAKTTDELFNKIESIKADYRVNPTEPIIENGTIIPGKNGKEIDVEKSYNNLSQSLTFSEGLLAYRPIYVKQRLADNKDKFIIRGNKNNKNVGFVFKVSNNDSIDKIMNILNKTSIKATFYVTSDYFENNYNLVASLIQSGHTIGNLSNNEDYNDSDFIWMSTILTNSGKQKNNYCYASYKNKDVLKVCNLHNSYTVIPNVIIDDHPFINVKKNIDNGIIISFCVTKKLNSELENIINYVISKGYNIMSLEELLKE